MAKKKFKIDKYFKHLKYHSKNKLVEKSLFVLILLFSFPLLILLIFSLFYRERVYPGISVAGVNIEGLDRKNAELVLTNNIVRPEDIVFISSNFPKKDNLKKEIQYKISTDDLGLSYNYTTSLDKAFSFGRSSDFIENIYLKISVIKRVINKDGLNLPLFYIIDEKVLNKFLEDLSSDVFNSPVYPSIKLINGQIIIDKGMSGQELDKDTIVKKVLDNISWAKNENIPIITRNIDVALSPENVQIAYDRAQKYYNKKLIIKFENQEFTYQKAEILKFIKAEGGFNNDQILEVLERISKEIEREPQNPVFKFEEGIVKEFLPAKDGIKVNKDNFGILLLSSLERIENSNQDELTIEVPVLRTSPPNRTEDVNNLGIKELIGTGVSYFKGSISSRIHNIKLAASKFNGILVAPDEVFSFNKILGDVSKFTGFQQAYIIQEGKTILGDGGGVCQVSTTAFRAALDSGLPIIERRAHAYRVSYYEQYSPPGIDATVFEPTTDFKFKNDTQSYILIQTIFEPKISKLTFEFYGTKDGRVSQTTKPLVTRPVPPPEDLYTDDPTLPAGQIKQIDWKAWGAKVTFNYKVTKGEEVIFEKTFISNYQPWQAKFLRGTGT